MSAPVDARVGSAPRPSATDRVGPLDALFNPRRVAVVGASTQSGRAGSVIWQNLADFPGEAIPVTPSHTMIDGHRAYPSLRDVEGPIDLAIIAVAAQHVPTVLDDAAAKHVTVAVVISAGFAETGPEGAALQADLIRIAREGGVRVVGPNCFGIQNCDLPLNPSLSIGSPKSGGGISLVTQSGAYGMAIYTMAVDEGIGFAKVYSAGNKADLTDAEVLDYLRLDPRSKTLCFYLESLPDGRAFYEAAQRTTPAKPLIVAKSGRSAAGARAARSHTAALAVDQPILLAALDQAGVIVARSGLEMMDAARALDSQPVPAGRRVAIVTNSGGLGVELADLLGEEGLDVPELSEPLQADLAALLPAFASARNPVDLTPVWERFATLYPMLIERLARSGEVDIVIPVLLQRAAIDEAVVRGVRDTVVRLGQDGSAVPVYVCWVAPRAAHQNAVLLQEAGIPCFDWPGRTASAVGCATRYGASRASRSAAAATQSALGSAPMLEPGLLPADVAARLLEQFGVPLVGWRLCSEPEEALDAAAALGMPVVAKVASGQVPHKTEVGGVRLGLKNEAEVETAARELLGLAPGAQVLVQQQASGRELIVGGIRDPEFGPVVMAGLGGIFVEVLRDVSFRLAPLDHATARAMLTHLQGYGILVGARGTEAVDLDSVAASICRVGELLCAVPQITEVDLNPVLAGTDGCVAADWRIVAGPGDGTALPSTPAT